MVYMTEEYGQLSPNVREHLGDERLSGKALRTKAICDIWTDMLVTYRCC